MKKILVIIALTVMSAAACATTPGGGGGGLVAGCYDSTTSNDSLIYTGPIGTYKNAQFAIDNGSCGSDPVNDHVTVVLAADEAAALAGCQTGPDPAACERISDFCSWARISVGMCRVARAPKPVEIP